MAQSTDSPPSPGRGRRWLIVGVVAGVGALALTAVVAIFSFQHDLSPQECERLESKKNVAVGYLENGPLTPHRANKLAEADELFDEIRHEKPGDPLGLRNLVITRLLQVQNADDADKPQIGKRAAEAGQALVAANEGSAIAHLLSGKIARIMADESRADAELTRAVELDPEDAALWYERFNFLEAARDPALQKKATEAMAHAYRAAPNNLAVRLKWLEVQAANNDSNLAETVAETRETLAHMPGLLANVAQLSNGAMPDPLAWLDKIKDSIEKNDWRTTRRLVGQFANLVRPEPSTQSDLRQIDRHPLEYVIRDFQATCPKQADNKVSPGPKVTLTELAAAEQPPALAGISDIVLADFDLDGRLDLIVLRDVAVEVYSRNSAGNNWRRIAEAPLPGGYQHLLAVDLDRDDPQQPGTEAHRQAQQRAPQAKNEGAAKERSDTPATLMAVLAGVGTAGVPGGSLTSIIVLMQSVAEPTAPCHRADLDVVVFGNAGVRFLQNTLNDDDSRSLVEAPQSAEYGELTNVTALAAADFYHDGDLDIALSAADGIRLLSNRGDLSFIDITSGSQLPNDFHATAMTAIDWDRDIDLDLILVDAAAKSAGYLENLRHGQFRWRPLETGYAELNDVRALEFLDAQQGSWSVVTAGDTGAAMLPTDVSRWGVVSPRPGQRLSRTAGRGVASWDFNNDGNTDLLIWSDNTIDFFHGMADGSVASMPPLFAMVPQNIRTCRVGDLDGDGDEDLAVAEEGRIVLYANSGGNENAWLDVELRAGVVDTQTIQFRANHFGLGSLIEVATGSRLQRKRVTAAKTHFGLGNDRHPDSIRVVWTTGVPQQIVKPDTDIVICDEQVLVGSCPYLYTWDGERFVFCTDCLWSAPLGLQSAEGQLAPSRAWEYLRIGGDQLRERNGHYDLRITEELWEAAYLDEVRLIAVDHPADVNVYSNEKVGPAEIAEFKIHTVREPRRPVAARDQQGRDILDRLARRDDVYVKPFDHTLAFGYTEDHFIELDFGKLDNPRQMTLFLTGWIFPSGTSMNVAISQNPGLKPPAAPSLWVLDADGQWREAIPYMGFPGGKTKTIAVDLSDVFLTDDYRLRIATNMEIYWDEAFITVDERPAETRQTTLRLVDADLHYRGFSQRTRGRDFGPEHYDYDRVSTDARWPVMRGHFTRYGDVRELLTQNDDLLVVLGAGDELSLRFAAPDNPPPAGWKRDFLLYNVGWDKDCDLNTIYGETVEPLPFGAMRGYPYTNDEDAPATARYRQYLRTYQTRIQDPGLFWQH